MRYRLLPALTLVVVLPHQAVANHGPATSAGGISVDSAEPLPVGEAAFVLREHYTTYENLSGAEIASRADAAGEFDYLNESFITTLGATYGVTGDIDLGATIGWYSGSGFVNAEGGDESGGDLEEPAVGNPTGLTDLTVRGKVCVASGTNSSLALLGGAVAPTGDQGERLSNGSTLDPSSQPGTGRFGLQGGLAFSHAFADRLKIDTSSLYTHRFERDDLRIGDRLDTGVAVSVQAVDARAGVPRVSVFGELNHIWLDKAASSEGTNQNSGGTSLFLTGGIRLDMGESLTLTVAPSVPVAQDPNGEQVEVAHKLTALIVVRL